MKKVLITLIILAIPITIYFIYNSNKESDENEVPEENKAAI